MPASMAARSTSEPPRPLLRLLPPPPLPPLLGFLRRLPGTMSRSLQVQHSSRHQGRVHQTPQQCIGTYIVAQTATIPSCQLNHGCSRPRPPPPPSTTLPLSPPHTPTPSAPVICCIPIRIPSPAGCPLAPLGRCFVGAAAAGPLARAGGLRGATCCSRLLDMQPLAPAAAPSNSTQQQTGVRWRWCLHLAVLVVSTHHACCRWCCVAVLRCMHVRVPPT
jgi:hypothetical protein